MTKIDLNGVAAPVSSHDAAAPPVRSPPIRRPGEPQGATLSVAPIPQTHDLVSDLCAYLETYLLPEQISECYRAYQFSAKAHEGQQRKSGEPYIHHPLAVARILAEMRMDYQCLIAALLHDVIEDTQIDKEQLAAAFGPEVAELVDGVSKLTQLDFQSRAEAQAASLQKMLLAMTRDIRVIVVKLADRLHNMRTLGAISRDSRLRIARETLDIYAPIANRLGINWIRIELEELAFAHYWPWRRRVLHSALQKRNSAARIEMINLVETALRQALAQEGIQGRVEGRQKHLYGIYRKMRDKSRRFADLADVFGFRVIVDRVDTCYRVFGVVHNLYKPVPGRFKDYIAIPKANGYQSLHTALIGPHGIQIEVQIRTEEMQRLAESGIAAHWMYKTGLQGANPTALAADWLQNLLEMQRQAGNSVEFLESVKVDLFPDEVYVFTPKGHILALKRGATAVDFAYAIHSDIGNTCVAARIDRRMAPLSTPLRSGQTVEIITAPGARPNPGWLNFVVTAKARANIRSQLKNIKQHEAQALGRRLLNAELSNLGATIETLNTVRLAAYLEEVGLPSLDVLLSEIGLGNRLAPLVARRLLGADGDEPAQPTRSDQEQRPNRFAIRGTEGMVIQFARCCLPIPGDSIMAIFSPGRGIVVHRLECRNLARLDGRRDRRLEVEWSRDPEGEFASEIRVEVSNRRGVLAVIAGAISELGSNIENVQTLEKDGVMTDLEFRLLVHGRDHLARIMRRLRRIPEVNRITRLTRS
ncbi:bifunctional (p)ppGpp synthetase/guanosine-3',5'-bis(diphosphate) 3'-pyrophosphohydrolase [Caldichromatium japonicum]|uniref:guanosine-3',5'-bis(diphosphate) 3'-diphosphatase n=1 Tax=Caldichromatium japonicum TaxID=2699430 RepID=A0A6G7V9S9_9GAMM|nr:bifunctional (p)ppGpp synthetase/guanosine-3',5'-bis(diphosphate) 3'-pyrophosphohydrolase [Caldichromatium japonicum]QIK36712.1 bifunctional (p)ppGpp synthetase/guanosine-3',5'-bis(diphosphate) 3'-pyrophosphohydrolase [Caldichromatium japonicum]